MIKHNVNRFLKLIFINFSQLETNTVDIELCQLLNDLFEPGVEKHMQKGYTILPANGILDEKLKIRETETITGLKRQVWWVFSGMGSQWPGMGKYMKKK